MPTVSAGLFTAQNRKRVLFCQCKQRLSFLTFWQHQMVEEVKGWWENISTTCLSSSSTPKMHRREQERMGFSGNVHLNWKTLAPRNHWHEKETILYSPFRNTKCKTFNFYNYSNLFPINIKQVYSPGPVAIDSALLFTCVKKQMALTYLMVGGREDGSGFMLV